MQYVKRRSEDGSEYEPEEEQRFIRVRRSESPLSSRMTRKMTKVDAELLALSMCEDPLKSMAPLALTGIDREAVTVRSPVVPPPIAIPCPFPFANTASTSMPTIIRDDSPIRDGCLTAPPAPFISSPGMYRTLVPREPEPFTIAPPPTPFSLPPRR